MPLRISVQRLMRHCLADEQRAYADHWLTFWNDLLRNDYAGHRLHRRRPQADHRLALSAR